MRWHKGQEPGDGAIRVVRRFLLIPRCIGDEYRWLEWAWIKQVYDAPDYANMGEGWWMNKEWVV